MTLIKKISRWILYIIALLVVLIIIALAIVRFVIFPNIDQYKQTIATQASLTLGQKVTIGHIEPSWKGISPSVSLKNIDVFDAENHPALHLNDVKATFSWISVPLMQPRLSQLRVRNPEITIRRGVDGTIYLAGISMAGKSNPDFANWLLTQPKVIVKDANVIWLDDFRKAPALSLNKLDLTLENPAWGTLFGQHLFAVSAESSTGTKLPIVANGSFYGNDISKIKNWYGKLFLDIQKADLTAWKPWIDYRTNIESGTGNIKVWLDFSQGNADSIKADLMLSNYVARLNETSEPFVAEHFSGQVSLIQNGESSTFEAKNIKLEASGGLNLEKSSGHITQSIKNDKQWVEASFSLNQFNLASIKQLQIFSLFPQTVVDQLEAFAPRGELSDINASWAGEPQNLSRYSVKSQFKGLGINAHKKIPGFENLSGDIVADQDGGQIVLDSTNVSLNFKDILRWPIPANKLNGILSWKTNNDKPFFIAKNIFITNPHVTGTINANYNMNGIKGGYLDLTGEFGKGDAKYAAFYYPIILGESTLHWLDTSILAGKAEDVHLTVKGSLADFPFVDSKNQPDAKLGIFRVTAKVSDALVEYGTGWPKVEGLSLNMLFEGKRMELNATKGNIFANKIVKSKIIIPQLDADWPMLLINSEVESSAADGIRFVNESPVKQITQGFTDGLKAVGSGKFNLELKIPMQDLEAAKYKGVYKITNGTIYANDAIGMPEISKVNGVLNFTEKNLSAQNINAEILGGPARLSLNTGADKIIRVTASGHISDVGIKKVAPSALTDTLQGSTDWTGNITINKPLVNLNISSNLIGMAVQLPAPLGKTATQEMLLSIDKKQLSQHEDMTDISYGNVVSAKILRNDKNGVLTFDRGDIGINVAAERPSESGLSLHGKLDYVNADDWLALLDKPSVNANKASITINKVDLNIQKFDIFNRKLNALKVIAKPSNTGLQMVIDSQEVTGNAEWQNAKNSTDAGKIIARLKNLTIPSKSETDNNATKKDIKRLDRKYPALDIVAENFQIGNKKLGVLDLNAFESNDDWIIQKLKISNPDGTLEADGSWHNWTRNPNTNLKFAFTIEDIGKTLKRFGQPDVVKNGKAEINGQLQWPGSPHEFESNGLNGNFTFEAKKGQILKVQPGVGRLLGLLSLQSLPRRLSLDFRDLFSEGFAFDKVSATAKIDKGIMRSDDFFMTGPAAEVKIKGETDLQKETQNLRIKVIPHISDSLSLAALAGGPIVGAAAFVAQKLLKDPFNKVAQSEYVITGTWDNPQEIDPPKEDTKKLNNSSPLRP